jgi:membrane protein implicated in regulation of membrane protease activity
VTPARADRLCLGWQYVPPHQEPGVPGPPPRRPTPPEQERLDADWAADQRRAEHLLNTPLRVACIAAAALGATAVALGAAGWLAALVAWLVVVCCVLVAAVSGYAIWQGERALRSRLSEEQRRVGKLRAAQQSRLFARQAEHASRVRQWQALRVAYQHQKRWYAVCAPSGIHRADIAGGTLPGWSALLTTAGAHRLAAGGQVTVLDLSGGRVAVDLIAFARTTGIEPVVLMLPGDLPRADRIDPVAAGGAVAPLLRVLVLDRRAEVPDEVFDSYLVMLTHPPDDVQRGSPWQHTLFVFGADRLRGDVIDRLCDACESTGTGLVLAYHAMPAHVRQRLGRGRAVLAFMRLSNPEEAKEVSEQLGTEHRFVLGQLTETADSLVTDSAAGSYPGTGVPAAGVPGTGGSGVASRRAGDGDKGIAGLGVTAWGTATAKAMQDGEARALEPAREFAAGQHELQHLPASAMIVSYPSQTGRQLVMVDANPGIGGLGAATMLTLEEFRAMPTAVTDPASAGEARTAPRTGDGRPAPGTGDGRTAPASWRTGDNRPPPNLGPPPPRLDWRKRPGA